MTVVCWSGGHDSTVALLRLARQSSWDKPVKALAICHPQVAAAKENRAARVAIVERLRKLGHFVICQEVTISHKTAFEWKEVFKPQDKRAFYCEPSAGTLQPILWIPTACMYLDEEEDLHMGYIRGDDIWHYRESVCYLFNNIQSLQYKKGKLVFPLEWEKKEDIIDELEKAGLLDLCWTCEAPKDGAACRKCSPCRKLWQAHKLHDKMKAEQRAADRAAKRLAKMEKKGK